MENEVAPIEGEEITEDKVETLEVTPIEGEEEKVVANIEGEAKENEPSVKELLGKIQKLERRQQYLQRKSERPGLVPEKEEQTTDKPKADNFENYEDYIDALSDYKVNRKIAERETANTKARQEYELEQKKEEFFSVIDSGVDKYSDFDEIARKPVENGGPTITAVMVKAMTECDNVVDIAYYLGKNVGISKKIARMEPIATAIALGKLDIELGNRIPQKIDTKAPSPTKPVGGKEVSSKKFQDMSVDEFIRNRNRSEGLIE